MVTYAVETGYFTKMICLKKDESQAQKINKTASWETEVVQIFILLFFLIFVIFPSFFIARKSYFGLNFTKISCGNLYLALDLHLILNKVALENFKWKLHTQVNSY